MAGDDRELRDRLEKLQTRAKALRAQLEDPARLDAVRVEVTEQLARLQADHAVALAKLAQVKSEAEDARMRSMALKRERAEADLLGSASSAARVTFGLVASSGAVLAAVLTANPWAKLGAPALGLCAVSAGCFLAVLYRIASSAKPRAPSPP